MNTLNTGAKFSRCRTYRYALWRIWDDDLPCVVFIGLNPSTADETKDDPTIKRCIGFAKDWGYGGVYVVNLFAFRATFPKDLKSTLKPIGSRNNFWVRKIANKCELILAAWGNDGNYLNQAKKMIDKLPEIYCLNTNKSGHPAHPLYQKSKTRPKRFLSKNL